MKHSDKKAETNPKPVSDQSSGKKRSSRMPIYLWVLVWGVLSLGLFGHAMFSSSNADASRVVVASSAVKPASYEIAHVPQLPQKPIEQVEIGDRVRGKNPQVTDAEREKFAEVDPETWRKIILLLPKRDDSILEIELLRPLSWFHSYGIYEGITDYEPKIEFDLLGEIESIDGLSIFLDMAELGAVGDALIWDIESCSKLAGGSGQIVTGTFKHHADKVLDIQFSGIKDAIGVTPSHPFWSADRQDFVEAGELYIDERVETITGYSQVVSIVPRAGPQPVYNIEVHGEHVYLITADGLLVHNACLGKNQIGHYRDGVNGKFDKHEVLNHSYLQAKGLAGNSRKRGNPVIALERTTHRSDVQKLQKEYGVWYKKDIENMSAEELINKNIKILEKLKLIKKSDATKLKDDALEFLRKEMEKKNLSFNVTGVNGDWRSFMLVGFSTNKV